MGARQLMTELQAVQAIFAAAPPKRPRRKPARYRHAPWTASQTYEFIGALRDPDTGRLQAYSFIVLAQDGVGPVITGGFAKLNVIDRPQRVGYTMPAGYDPVSMDVAVQFEAMTHYDDGYSPQDLEDDVQIMEWMAGRGKLYERSKVGAAAVGDPPIVQLRSVDEQLRDTGLVPRNVQGLPWMIANIQPGVEIRAAGSGLRRRFLVTISLTQWVPVPTTRIQLQNGFQVYATTTTDCTVLDVVVHRTGVERSDVHALKTVLDACRAHRVPVKSYRQKLKPGTKIYIPNDLFRS